MADTQFAPPVINLHENTLHAATLSCFQSNEPVFAMPKHGNAVKHYVTGQSYFDDLGGAILGAKKFILFTDWQMDYDVEIIARGEQDFHGRLSELLAKKVAQGVEIKVLLYDSVEAAVYTHENAVRENLMRLNPKDNEFVKPGVPKRNPNGNLPVEVAIQKPNTGRALANVLFSHHQKSVVIDGNLAFVGGLDVTYGRWCTANFDVVADPVKHRINDLYNPCIASGRLTTVFEEAITADWAGQRTLAEKARKETPWGVARPGFAPPYYIIGTLTKRIAEIFERGYSLEQVLVLIQIMEVPNQIRDYLLQKGREIRALADAISRVINQYEETKKKAVKKLVDGQFIDAIKLSIKADVDLAKVVFRKLGQAADAVTDAIADAVGSSIDDFSQWWHENMREFRGKLARYEQYARDPELMVVDLKRFIQDVKDLPSQFTDNFLLEEGCQPRLPWQDIQCKVIGPAVHDLFANFVRRWNVAVHKNTDNTALSVSARNGLDYLVCPLNDKWLSRWDGTRAVLGDVTQHGAAGSVTVQVVRSMAHSLLKEEAEYAKLLPLAGLNGKSLNKGYANHTVAGERHMDGILEAMIHAIRSAEAYIYIETQFFISAADKSNHFEDPVAKNPLVDELADRIGAMIGKGLPFHVYVVLPVHPEGNLGAGAVAKQHYWALQSLKRARGSLINRICQALVIKDKKLKPGQKPNKDDVQDAVKAERWQDYLTVLNLRNWGLTTLFPRDPTSRERDLSQAPKGHFVITEQIYVHSKLMIVDDAIAIIGSANVNDRSLQGDGDSELAVVIVDNEVKSEDLGNGVLRNTRKYAQDLRIALWEKHLGLGIEEAKYTRCDVVRGEEKEPKPGNYLEKLPNPPRTRAQSAPGAAKVNLKQPASPATWKAIQALTRQNAQIYEAVFQHTPRNSMAYFSETETGWPKRASRMTVGARAIARVTGTSSMVGKQVAKKAEADVLVTDYSTLPPQLQKTYMRKVNPGEAVPYEDFNVEWRDLAHNTSEKTFKNHDNTTTLSPVEHLRKLVGFWVEMPLDFGHYQADKWLSGKLGAEAIAANEMPPEPGAEDKGVRSA